MGMYATREDEIDRLLRAGRSSICIKSLQARNAGQCGRVFAKKVEAFYGFERKTPLETSRTAMRYIVHRLELGVGDRELPEKFREAMEGYNGEDCVSTAKLRDWLEAERKKVTGRRSERAAIRGQG